MKSTWEKWLQEAEETARVIWIYQRVGAEDCDGVEELNPKSARQGNGLTGFILKDSPRTKEIQR